MGWAIFPTAEEAAVFKNLNINYISCVPAYNQLGAVTAIRSPESVPAIAKMVAALKPGGWLLVEEPDYISGTPDPSMPAELIALSQKCWDAMLYQLRSQGYDTALGRHLYHDVTTTGLGEVQAEGFVAMQLGINPWGPFWRITFEQLEPRIAEAGLLTVDECNDYKMLLESPSYRWLNPLCMSVWGRRVSA